MYGWLPMRSPALEQVLSTLEDVVDSGEVPITVFDLDSTLFSTHPRNLRILQEFADAHGGEYEGLREVVESLGPDDMGWDIGFPLSARGFTDPALLKAVKGFWFKRFFTDEYVVSDTPTPGAVEFVAACYERGCFIYYLTGRDVPGMKQGTVSALIEHGFPYLPGRTLLHLKPNFHLDDKTFKNQAIRDIRTQGGRVIATFENEPGNANLFFESFPEAEHFLLLTEHSAEAEVPVEGLIQVEDFR